STEFKGDAGRYDLTVAYFDEIDGAATINVLVDGEAVGQIDLDQQLGGIKATAGNAATATFEGLELDTGSKIELVGQRDGFEFARIDKVTLTPAPLQTIAEIASADGNFDILVKALGAADLVAPFADPTSDFTVFAPTDAAFAALAADFGYTGDPADEDAVFDAIAGALAGLAEDGDPIPVLANVLKYHVSPEAKLLADVAALDDVPTLLEGATFSPDGVTLVDNEPDLKDPSLIATDLEASNGVIHVIDRVLIPLDIPGNGPSETVVEAEDMELSGYRVEHDGDASNDALIKLSAHEGTASTVFHGRTGEYDLKLHYFDEIDGEASIRIFVNDDEIEQLTLDDDLGGRFATEENAVSITIAGLQLEQGDTISFEGKRDDYEFARIDKVVISPVAEDDDGSEVISLTEDALV
ncbi:MAG: fasciclin domain-containing protein, partial [Pseudomonadota bacterium]